MKNLTVTITLLCSVLCCYAQPNYVAPNGIKAYWPFDAISNATDLVAGYTSTLYPSPSAPTLTNNRFGSTNNAYQFNGANWIGTAYKGILGDSARAVSFWAKTPGNGGGGMYLVGWGGNGIGDRFGCSLDYPPNQVAVGGANCSQIYNTPLPACNNTWHHYVFQFSKSFGPTLSDVKVWQDAIQIYTTSANAYQPFQVLNTVNNFNVTFGKIIYPPSPNFYTGDLDEIGIWQRVLTQCEISDLYYADLTIGTMTFNPLGYTGSVNNLAQYTKTVTGNSQFSIPVTGSSFSGNGVTYANGAYHFNNPPILPPGNYTIAHTYTLQGGCVRTTTQVLLLKETVGIRQNSQNPWAIDVFPNPTSGELHISASNAANQHLHINIADLSGRIIYTAEFENEKTFDLSTLTNAVYILEVSDKKGNSFHKKILLKP